MPRTIPEWQGRTDDSAVPDKVRERILMRQRNADGDVICPDCGNIIRPGHGVEFDHAVPLIDGGRHAEGNLRAIHRKPCHQLKSAREALARAEARAATLSHYGARGKRMQGRGFAKRPPQRTASRPVIHKSDREAMT